MKAGTCAHFLPVRLPVGLGPESMYTFTSNNMILLTKFPNRPKDNYKPKPRRDASTDGTKNTI